MSECTGQAYNKKKSAMYSYLLLTLLITFCCSRKLLACSPGPGYGYRTAPRHLNPLLKGQFIPAISETTIGASGPSKGRITKDSFAYSKLVSNYNPSIIFADIEGDGSDRRMTQRCKERLNTLAGMVANQWAGVRLRVTEAWDNDGDHKKGSLHYEGRAVDITTSDKDTKKYGMLARLAVEAGFDWVYYKSTYYIHASVRSDDAEDTIHGGCFPGNSVVISKDNRTLLIRDLVPGVQIQAVDRHTGKLVYSDVVILMDRNVDVFASFVKISTNYRTVTLTSNHMIYVMDDVSDNSTIGKELSPTIWRRSARPMFAGDVKPGQVIYIKSLFNSDFATSAVVTSTKIVEQKGVVAPLTTHGTVIVDGVVTSCYSVFKNEPLAHASLSPIRTFQFLRGSNQKIGLHWYTRTLEKVARSFFPRSFFRYV